MSTTPKKVAAQVAKTQPGMRAAVTKLSDVGLSPFEIFALIMQYGPALLPMLKLILDALRNKTALPPVPAKGAKK